MLCEYHSTKKDIGMGLKIQSVKGLVLIGKINLPACKKTHHFLLYFLWRNSAMVTGRST